MHVLIRTIVGTLFAKRVSSSLQGTFDIAQNVQCLLQFTIRPESGTTRKYVIGSLQLRRGVALVCPIKHPNQTFLSRNKNGVRLFPLRDRTLHLWAYIRRVAILQRSPSLHDSPTVVYINSAFRAALNTSDVCLLLYKALMQAGHSHASCTPPCLAQDVPRPRL